MPLPTVRKRPRARNRDGTWRKKRSDSGKKRKMNEDLDRPMTEETCEQGKC